MKVSRVCALGIVVAASAPVASARAQSAAPLVPVSVKWPERIAVGMRSGDQIGPLTVEAQSDGWVIVTILPRRADAGVEAPAGRLIAKASDVKAWIVHARAFMNAPADPVQDRIPSPELTLGGRYRFQVSRPGDGSGQIDFSVRACEPRGYNLTTYRGELDGFLALLDSAVTAAGTAKPVVPNRQRRYYASELSCSARPHASNAVAGYPDFVPVAQRKPGAVGVRYVVDTLGHVERNSIEFLPGTDALQATLARSVIEHWTFTPADWGGVPVRQIVQQAIPFQMRSGQSADSVMMELSSDSDGWVHLRTMSILPEIAASAQEWFAPDSIMAWARRVDSIMPAPGVRDRGSKMIEHDVSLGRASGIQYSVSFATLGKQVARAGTIVECNQGAEWSAPPVDIGVLQTFRAVARDARASRKTPADPAATVHAIDDVACQAWLPWQLSTMPHARAVWEYPTGVYPADMASSNAHADVFYSVVVDTAGVADVSTLLVMPGADPRAVPSLVETLREVRFRPATRGGVAVPQRVMQSMRFEPPPMCSNVGAGPSCARQLSQLSASSARRSGQR
jgi:hypothetical protein